LTWPSSAASWPLAVPPLSPTPGIDCGVAASGGDLLLEIGELDAGGRHAVADRADPGEDAHEALLELETALLGLLERDLAAAQLLVEELERLAGLAAVAREVLLDEQVDQALDGGGRGARVLAVGEAGNVRIRLDLERAVGLGGDDDARPQRRYHAREVAVAGDQAVEIGAADDADQILVRGQGLLEPEQLVVAIFERAARDIVGRIDWLWTNRRALAS